MRTLKVSISDIEFNEFGIEKNSLTFTEFVELLALMWQNLNKRVALAEKTKTIHVEPEHFGTLRADK